MLELVTEIFDTNVPNRTQIHLKRKCAGKLEIFIDKENDPIISLPNFEGSFFKVGYWFFYQTNKMTIKYESEYTREPGVSYEL